MNTFASLSSIRRDASWTSMRARFLIFFMALTVLTCSISEPIFACADDTSPSLSSETDAAAKLISTVDDEKGSQPAGDPQSAVSSHHCCVATPSILATLTVVSPPKVTLFAWTQSAVLHSFAQAPPIEPPAA